jgi:hypothetical protein
MKDVLIYFNVNKFNPYIWDVGNTIFSKYGGKIRIDGFVISGDYGEIRFFAPLEKEHLDRIENYWI